MRIISGKLKGKPINFLKNGVTRPLKDSVKENIFNILKHSNLIKVKIENSSVLDLYSGVGSFGLECLSRNSKKVTFIEQDKNTVNVLNNNLIDLAIAKMAIVHNSSVENVLSIYRKNKFDIFFFDPPFSDESFIQNLNLIKKNKIYNSNHIVIVHRDSKTKDNLENFMNTIIVKKYARSKIIFGIFN